MGNGGEAPEVARRMPERLLTLAANEALAKFRELYGGISETDALNALLTLGGAVAEMGQTGEFLYRANDGEEFSWIVFQIGNGQITLG